MESWIRNALNNSGIVDLQIVASKSELVSKPCLSSNYKGLFHLIPLRIFDPDLMNLKPSTKSSLLISENKDGFPQILLEGEVLMDTSQTIWETMKEDWLAKYEELIELFDIKELFLPQQNRQTLLKFKPNRITAWENFYMDPVIIELEIFN